MKPEINLGLESVFNQGSQGQTLEEKSIVGAGCECVECFDPDPGCVDCFDPMAHQAQETTASEQETGL